MTRCGAQVIDGAVSDRPRPAGRSPALRAVTVLALGLALQSPLSAAFAADISAPGADRVAAAVAENVDVSPSLVRRTATCAECHGPDGNSRYPWVPNLAAQNAGYLLDQLLRFRNDVRRDHVMSDIVALLDERELAGLANYYARLPLAPVRVPDTGRVQAGARLYASRCSQCHAADGRGSGAQSARVAGQQPEYVRRTLRRFRDGSRTRINATMSEAVRGLSDSDLAALAAYLAWLR